MHLQGGHGMQGGCVRNQSPNCELSGKSGGTHASPRFAAARAGTTAISTSVSVRAATPNGGSPGNSSALTDTSSPCNLTIDSLFSF